MEEQYFNEMRQQMAALKEQLDKQEIVSDRLIREIMNAKKKDINSTKNALLSPSSASRSTPSRRHGAGPSRQSRH